MLESISSPLLKDGYSGIFPFLSCFIHLQPSFWAFPSAYEYPFILKQRHKQNQQIPLNLLPPIPASNFSAPFSKLSSKVCWHSLLSIPLLPLSLQSISIKPLLPPFYRNYSCESVFILWSVSNAVNHFTWLPGCSLRFLHTLLVAHQYPLLICPCVWTN